jgi:hypothetical protein
MVPEATPSGIREGQGKARQTGHQDSIDPLYAGLLRFRRYRRCPESGGHARILRLVLQPADIQVVIEAVDRAIEDEED